MSRRSKSGKNCLPSTSTPSAAMPSPFCACIPTTMRRARMQRPGWKHGLRRIDRTWTSAPPTASATRCGWFARVKPTTWNPCSTPSQRCTWPTATTASLRAFVWLRKHPDAPSKQHVLAYAVPASQLAIRPYHRVLRHPGWDVGRWEEAFDTLSDCLSWQRIEAGARAPSSVGHVHVHTAEQSWALAWNEDLQTDGAVDAEVLQEHVSSEFSALKTPETMPDCPTRPVR